MSLWNRVFNGNLIQQSLDEAAGKAFAAGYGLMVHRTVVYSVAQSGGGGIVIGKPGLTVAELDRDGIEYATVKGGPPPGLPLRTTPETKS